MAMETFTSDPKTRAHEGRIADNIVHFARTLRKAGVRVGPASVVDAIDAVMAGGIGSRDDFYWTLHATLIKRREDHAVFDEAFRLYWRSRELIEKMLQMFSPQVIADKTREKRRAAESRVGNALFDGQDGVVAQYQSQIRFGLSLYTSDGGFNGGECPIISEVAPAIDNGAAMQSLYDMNGPQGDTPTGESIDAVVPTLLGLPDDGPKVIVVATDGEPDTCAEPNPQNGQGVAVTAATNSFDAGVPVYIISVGSDISDQHLQDMANAGLGVQPGDPDAPFWKANEPQALLDAFNTIINGVRDCKLELNGEVQEGKEEECAVEINMQEVPYNDPDGWQLNSPSEIELVGQACDSIQEGEVEVDIKCSCEAFIE